MGQSLCENRQNNQAIVQIVNKGTTGNEIIMSKLRNLFWLLQPPISILEYVEQLSSLCLSLECLGFVVNNAKSQLKTVTSSIQSPGSFCFLKTFFYILKTNWRKLPLFVGMILQENFFQRQLIKWFTCVGFSSSKEIPDCVLPLDERLIWRGWKITSQSSSIPDVLRRDTRKLWDKFLKDIEGIYSTAEPTTRWPLQDLVLLKEKQRENLKMYCYPKRRNGKCPSCANPYQTNCILKMILNYYKTILMIWTVFWSHYGVF